MHQRQSARRLLLAPLALGLAFALPLDALAQPENLETSDAAPEQAGREENDPTSWTDWRSLHALGVARGRRDL